MGNDLLANALMLFGVLLLIPLAMIITQARTVTIEARAVAEDKPALSLEEYGDKMYEVLASHQELEYTLGFTNMTRPTPEMRKIARSLKRGTAWGTVWDSYKWVYNNIEYVKDDETFPETLPASVAFEKGKGICDEQALVLISFLRVNGIASRYRFEVNDEGKQHACTEVLFPYNGFYKIVKVGCLDGYKRVKVKEW